MSAQMVSMTMAKSIEANQLFTHSTGVQGWQGFVKVDDQVYNWMGGAPGAPDVDQLSMEYTTTRSIFNMSVAGKVDMRIEFLSPVFPDDLKRQSIPFSYIVVNVKSRDGASHKVQVYSDVSGGASKYPNDFQRFVL